MPFIFQGDGSGKAQVYKSHMACIFYCLEFYYWAFDMLILDEVIFYYDGKGKLRRFDTFEKLKKEHSVYSNLIQGSKENTRRTETSGIPDKAKLRTHTKKHAHEVGAKNEREYNNLGAEFMSKPLDEGMEDLILENKRYRYDYQTNEFGIASREGFLHTYYKLKKGAEQWEMEVMEYGEKE